MKLVLKFDLDDDTQDGREEVMAILRVGELQSALSDVRRIVRSRLKHGQGVTQDEAEILESIRAALPDWVV